MTDDTIYREAYHRLKDGRPTLLPKGTEVSQNMVAREAGKNPSDFKKSRFGHLIAEIQEYVASRKAEAASLEPIAQVPSAERRPKRSLEEKYRDMKSQRDLALSMLVEADTLILELSQELESIKAARGSLQSNVTPIVSGRKEEK